MGQFTIRSKMKRAANLPTILKQMDTDTRPESRQLLHIAFLNWESIQAVNIYEMLAENVDVHLGQLISYPSSSFREAWWLVTATTLAADVSVSFLTQRYMCPYTNFFFLL